MVAPRIAAAEPLSLELEDFATAIVTGRQPRSHADFGLEIVRVLGGQRFARAAGATRPSRATPRDDEQWQRSPERQQAPER